MLPLQMTNRVNQTGDRFCRKLAEQCKCNPEGFDVTEYVFFSFCSKEKFEDTKEVIRSRVHPRRDNTRSRVKRKRPTTIYKILQIKQRRIEIFREGNKFLLHWSCYSFTNIVISHWRGQDQIVMVTNLKLMHK